ncbi:MAG: organomercurial lyase [Oligoflexales bacterium]
MELSKDARATRKIIYQLWPTLGRPPSIDELRHFCGNKFTESIIEELMWAPIEGIQLSKCRKEIVTAWPFSAKNLGIQVHILGFKPIFARCAVDALGISKMFNKPVDIIGTTENNGKLINLKIDKEEILKADPSIFVAYRDCKDCDNIKFYSIEPDAADLDPNLKLIPLSKALARGVLVFGDRLQ